MPLTGEDDLVGCIYDAALDSRSWQDIGYRLVRHMEASTLMLLVHDPMTQSVDLVATLGLTATALSQYGEYYAQHDLWVTAARAKQLFDQVLLGSNVVEDRILEQSQFYHDFLRPVGIHHLTGAMIRTADGKHAVIGVQRPRDARAYDEGELRRLGRLLPHLQRAMEIRQKLKQSETRQQTVLAALDHLRLGVVMIGRTGKIVHINAAAESILDLDDGLARTSSGLRAARRDDDRRLQELLAAVRRALLTRLPFQAAGGHLRINRPSGRQPYAVMITPIGPALASGAGAPAVLVFIGNPDALPSDSTILMDLFGFSASEARLVMALLSGTTLPAFAREKQISYNTVRTLLARAMARTDTHSQIDLVCLVANALGAADRRQASQ